MFSITFFEFPTFLPDLANAVVNMWKCINNVKTIREPYLLETLFHVL